MANAPYNPWREFIENVISGDNHFRRAEYHDLLSYIDALLEEIDTLKKHKCPTAFDYFVQDMEEAGQRGNAA